MAIESINRWIWITFQKTGIHCYPDAAINPKLADVSFLGFEHRHLFKFKVMVEVAHNDRDLEFLTELLYMESLYERGVLVFNHKSCEMLAEELLLILSKRYEGKRDLSVEVSEDGENGCLLELAKSQALQK